MERIQIVRGDITDQQVDVIVNAANSTLLGGGGVDGAIHRAAGPELLEECRRIGGCPTGESRITLGYQLPAKYVIHTVGPVWRGGMNNEPQLLGSCYRTALELARLHNCDAVAFPAISCGVYGYPIDLAAFTSIEAVRQYLSEHDHPRLVRWVLFDAVAYEAWRSAAQVLQQNQSRQ